MQTEGTGHSRWKIASRRKIMRTNLLFQASQRVYETFDELFHRTTEFDGKEFQHKCFVPVLIHFKMQKSSTVDTVRKLDCRPLGSDIAAKDNGRIVRHVMRSDGLTFRLVLIRSHIVS